MGANISKVFRRKNQEDPAHISPPAYSFIDRGKARSETVPGGYEGHQAHDRIEENLIHRRPGSFTRSGIDDDVSNEHLAIQHHSLEDEDEISPIRHRFTNEIYRKPVSGPVSRRTFDDDEDEYYDDEDMMRCVSALSLVEYNRHPPSSASPSKEKRLPAAIEDFFAGLDAEAARSSNRQAWSDEQERIQLNAALDASLNAASSSKVRPELDLSPWQTSDPVLTRLLQENSSLILASKQNTKECGICIEEKTFDHFPRVTEVCKHPEDICLSCVQDWLARELDHTDWDKINCVACREVVPYNDMKRLMKPAAFEKYDNLALASTLSTLPSFHYCISPTCPSGQIHPSPSDEPLFICTSCLTTQCIVHNIPWHEGESCEEYDYRQDPARKEGEERESRKEIRESSKVCPGEQCGVRITRNGGCDHMKCTRCGFEFCWLCLADYNTIRREGNTAHEESCKLHSNNLPD